MGRAQEKIKFLGNYYHLQISPTGEIEAGDNVQVRSFVSLEVNNNACLILENNVYINDHSTIRCFKRISIGENTMLGDGVRIYDFDHTYTDYHIGRLSSKVAPVSIGKNSWIGANCVITKGVSIGDNVIIGAGTVVTKDIPNNCLVHSDKELVIKKRNQADHHIFTLTASDRLEQFPFILEALPEIHFHIAAGTMVSENLLSLGEQYQNCQIYPLVYADYSIDRLIEQADIYLDINHGHEVDGILKKVLDQNIPILSFDTVSKFQNEYIKVFSEKEPETMVDAIKKIIESKNK